MDYIISPKTMIDVLKRKKGMKLLTKEIEKNLPPLYSQDGAPDPVCHAKFFSIVSDWKWYPLEYDPEERMFYGYVHGMENELGEFSLDELEAMGACIERDTSFVPTPLSEIRRWHER
jgi:hypothetical protein